MSWTEHRIDGGIVHFHRDSLINVLRRGPSTMDVRRVAPRTLQVGLLTPCNLRCGFCYRDQAAPSRLTAPFLLDLLEKSCAWGVLEVAFGGGEPLLFKGFVEMLRELRARTSLGIGFTTNGTLVTDEIIGSLRGVVSEIRVSAYADNGYRATLHRLRDVQAGVNWLVTPANVGFVEPYVVDFIEQGAKNVLLLGYKGEDRSLHLNEDGFAVLRRALRRLEGAPIRLDVCWYPHLRDVPQLFQRGDCGAGDEFLVITPDRAVQSCSFARTRRPFDTFDDLRRIYGELRSGKPEAETLGCTRSLFARISEPGPEHESAWVWRAAASNNSGDWTIAARFCDAATATRVAESLRELSRAHEAFLASPEGRRWIEDRGYDGSDPTPPLSHFGEVHGFDWATPGDGLQWEEDGSGAPVLTAGAIGDSVVVYHPYCMGLPEGPFRAFFERTGATQFESWRYDRPRVLVRARGRNDLLERRIEDYLLLVRASKYACDVEESPPWGAICADPRVHDDEDRDTRLSSGDGGLQRENDWVRVTLSFNNSFAGALALSDYLSANGYADVEVSMESELSPLGDRRDRAALAPKTGLFGDVRPIAERLMQAAPETIVASLFRAGRLSDQFKSALAGIAPERVAELGLEEARSYWARQLDVSQVCVETLEHLPSSRFGQVWARELWEHLIVKRPGWCLSAVRVLAAALPRDEAFSLVAAWCSEPSDPEERGRRLVSTFALRDPRCLDLYEKHWRSLSIPPAVTDSWCRAVVDSGLPWSTARRWVALGRPLSLLALCALEVYSEKGAPDKFGPPELGELKKILQDCAARDSTPRVRRAVDRVLLSPGAITRGTERS